jgi:hypothetical protein
MHKYMLKKRGEKANKTNEKKQKEKQHMMAVSTHCNLVD